MHTLAPAREYWPAGHRVAVGVVLPLGHTYPAAQLPLHAADARAIAAPYTPAGHWTQVAEPPKLYRPGAHATAVPFHDPEGHENPARHKPLHTADAGASPKVPGAHGVH